MAMRRPEEEAHLSDLVRLGDTLRELRQAACITQVELSRLAGLSDVFVYKIEKGYRRTRASTLARLARVLAEEVPRIGTMEEITAELVKAAGGSLAPESEYRERIERRRDRRVKREMRARVRWAEMWAATREQAEVMAREMVEEELARRAEQRQWANARARERRYQQNCRKEPDSLRP